MRPEYVLGAMCFSGWTLLSTPSANAQQPRSVPIPVEFQIEGEFVPDRVKGPDGKRFLPNGRNFEGEVARPIEGVAEYNLEVVYDEQSYPIAIRVDKATEIVRIPVAIEKPSSCSSFHLKKRERSSTTISTALKHALTLGFMIETRSGTNSCDIWPFRAARARHDRYYNAMTSSEFLIIPKTVEQALLASAKSDGELRQAQARITSGQDEGKKRYAIVTQRKVTLAKSDDEKLRQSILLQETLSDPAYETQIKSVISRDVIEKQVRDFQQRVDAAAPREGELSPL